MNAADLQGSNVGALCQAIILRSVSQATNLLETGQSSWDERFLSDDSGICALDLAIMWFPELLIAIISESDEIQHQIDFLRLPMQHPTHYSFLELACNAGWFYGRRVGIANEEDYRDLIRLAAQCGYPVRMQHINSLALEEFSQDLAEALSKQRSQLRLHAIRSLKREVVDRLGLFRCKMVDENVRGVVACMQAVGANIPEALHPGSLEDIPSLADSVYQHTCSSELGRESLEHVGFDPEGFIRYRCRAGNFPTGHLVMPVFLNEPLFTWLSRIVAASRTEVGFTKIHYEPLSQRWNGETKTPDEGPYTAQDSTWKSEYSVESSISFVHAMTAYAGHAMPGWTDAGFSHSNFQLPDDKDAEIISPQLKLEVKDGCVCGCSIAGCMPLTTFLKVMIPSGSALPSSFEAFQYQFVHCAKVVGALLGNRLHPSIAIQFLRVYIFELLDCRHTCCVKTMRLYAQGRISLWPRETLDSEERAEIHQEDAEKLITLERLLALLEHELETKCRDLAEFVDLFAVPLLWAEMVKQNAKRLNETELNEISDIGVRWDSALQGTREDNSNSEAESVTESESDVESEILSPELLYTLETDEVRMRMVKFHIDKICS